MSEYQYYEFQALERPLTEAQMGKLREASSRARITPTNFVNVYNWGSFGGNVKMWMERYFDAFLYVANWGTHRLIFRLPRRLLDPETVEPYSVDDGITLNVAGDYSILEFQSDEEPTIWEEGEGRLAGLTPLRNDLMRGDLRSLYIGWLSAATAGHVDDESIEPPVPPGLARLTAPLRNLAEFLRVSTNLIAAAAEESADEESRTPTPDDVARWVAALPSSEKDTFITCLLTENDSQQLNELRLRAMRELQDAKPAAVSHHTERRTVAQLFARAEDLTRKRETKKAKEQAQQRERHLRNMLGKEETLWARIEKLVAARDRRGYPDAVSMLRDLRDLSILSGEQISFESRLDALRRQHSRKYGLMQLLRNEGLLS